MSTIERQVTYRTEPVSSNVVAGLRVWFYRLGPLLCVGGVLVAAMSVLVGLAVMEWRASQWVNGEYARLVARELPFDNATAEAMWRKRTHDEGTAHWVSIINTLAHLPWEDATELPVVGSGELPEQLVPGVAWEDESAVAAFLEWMRPLINRIEEAEQFPKPVWFPVHINGLRTMFDLPLTRSRSIARLLQLEVKHAAYHLEPDRAMRAIRSLKIVADSFDTSLALVGELVSLALRGMHYDAIQGTLAFAFWNEAHIDTLLAETATPLDVADRWRTTVAFERALVLASVRTKQDMSGIFDEGHRSTTRFMLPSDVQEYLRVMQRIEELPTGNLQDFEQEAKLLDPVDTKRFSVARIFVPLVAPIPNVYVRSENLRRLTRTALGIKKYYLRNATWPQQLSDLPEVGLTSNDFNMVNGRPFVYYLDAKACEVATQERIDEEERLHLGSQRIRFAVTVGN